MIRIEQLRKSFDRRPVLDCPAQTFASGCVHGIVGLNGAGKTTFFNLLASFLQPDSGSIRLDGRPLSRQQTGFLETGNYFYSNITGQEYLDIFPASNPQFDQEKLNSLMQLPLQELTENYSTGMKKKLALLALLRQDKTVYILDEPFNGLDLESNRMVEIIIRNLKEKGKTVFVSSHILAPLTGICDEIHLLRNGGFHRTYTRPEFGSVEEELFADFNARAGEIIAASV